MKITTAVLLLTILLLSVGTEAYVPKGRNTKGQPKQANSRVTNTYKKLELDCRIQCNLKEADNRERDPDSTEENCRRDCINSECNKLHFSEYELEDGEVDNRESLFKDCVYRHLDAERKKSEVKASSTSDASDTVLAILPLVVFVCIVGIVLYAI